MSATSVTLRCPACGQDLRAVPAPAPPTQWFSCPRCHAPVPVVVPRDPPPLYSWEVLPGLYPTLPRPRAPRWQARRVAATGLVGIVVLAAAFAGILTYYGVAATGPATYTVSGTVYAESISGSERPAAGASVTIDEENGGTQVADTGIGGGFSFSSVPSGGMALHVALGDYEPGTVSTFASPGYDAGTSSIAVVLVPVGYGNSTNASLTPFPDLESFLASIGTGVVLLGLVAVIALVAAWLTLRADRPALGVIGGAAGLTAPIALYLLALGYAFPVVLTATTVLAAFGGFTLAVRAIDIGQVAPAPGRD